jgi:hypothetical protein
MLLRISMPLIIPPWNLITNCLAQAFESNLRKKRKDPKDRIPRYSTRTEEQTSEYRQITRNLLNMQLFSPDRNHCLIDFAQCVQKAADQVLTLIPPHQHQESIAANTCKIL